MATPYTKEAIIEYMSNWYLAHYEDPSENTPRDSGEWVFIWGEPISPQVALSEEFSDLFSEALINETAEQLCKEHDIFEWVPVPEYEEEESSQ
jgi:hypothetical protein